MTPRPSWTPLLRGRTNWGVSDQLRFELIRAEDFLEKNETSFDIVSCIGAAWIGGNLRTTLDLMKNAAKTTDSWVLVGEPFWKVPPPDGEGDWCASTLESILESVESAGLELVEMVVANSDDFDRYEASQWLAMDDWLRENPSDPQTEGFREVYQKSRSVYFRFGRQRLGWGVFVLRNKQ